LVPLDNATYRLSGTTMPMCPSLPPPFVVEMVTSAAVSCIVSLYVVIRQLPVDLGDFKCLESIEHVLEDAHDCFEQLPLF